MSIALEASPGTFTPAYKPVRWSFTSSRGPTNTTQGEVNLPIFVIFLADQAQAALIPGVQAGDTVVVLANPAPGVFQVGGSVSLQGTTAGRYDGTSRILRVLSDQYLVIATEGSENSVGGTASLVYDGFKLVADVSFGTDAPQRYILDAAPDGTFSVDIRDQAQRSFSDVFDKAIPGAALSIVDTFGHITNEYRITVYEAWVVYSRGVGTFTVNDKDPFNPSFGKPSVVVNSVQPYHHSNEWTGAVDLDWNENLFGYIVNTAAASPRRWLTYAPQSTEGVTDIYPGDHYWLGFLTFSRVPLEVRVTYKDEAGNTLDVESFNGMAPINCGIVPCGPSALTIPSGTRTYTVQMFQQGTGLTLTVPMTFRLMDQCLEAPRRVYALNKFGAIDAFTFTTPEMRTNGYAVETVSRPTMPASVPNNAGSWQRRTWRSQPARQYTITSPILSKAWLRYVADEILESPDLRTVIYADRWTRLINSTQSADLGYRHGRVTFSFMLGVDNEVQRR
jgi:hypothetical protein